MHDTFHELIQNAPMGVYLVDGDFRLRQVSAGCAKVFANVDPLIGRDFAEILRIVWPEPFASEAIGRFRHTLATGEPYHSPNTTEQRGDIPARESYDWQIQRLTLPDGSYGVICYFYDMTHRLAAELAIRESEERLQAALEGGQLGAWSWDPATDRAALDDRTAALFGLDPATHDADASLVFGAIHPDDFAGVYQNLTSATQPGHEYRAEFRVRLPDGSTRWLAGIGRGRFDAQGTLQSVFGVNFDITERKLAEGDARLLAALAERIRTATNADLLLAEASALLGDHLGLNRCYLSQRDIPGAPWHVVNDYHVGVSSIIELYQAATRPAYYTPDLGAGRVLVTNDVMLDPRSVADSRTFAHAGIRALVVVPLMRGGHWTASLVAATVGPRTWTRREVALIEQVAERTWSAVVRLRHDAALRESEERFRLMANAAPAIIWINDEHNELVFMNEEYVRFVGRAPQQLLGAGWRSAVHPEDEGAYLAAYTKAAGTFERFQAEFRFRRQDGEYRWMRSVGVPRFEGGAFVGYIGSTFDIHDSKQAEESLRDADRRKDAFLALLAHELRNPLAPVRNAVEIIRRSAPGEVLHRSAIGTLDRQVSHMVRLIDDLLDVSRISTGKLRLKQERLEFTPVVRQALETVQPLVEDMGHVLSFRSPDGPVFVNGDATRLMQVVENLLNNACKYTAPGGRIDVRLDCDGEAGGNEVVLTIADTGVGLPQDQLDRIFDMFAQVDGPERASHGGLGLGLTLVRSLVEMHGGCVRATSRGVGHGAEFEVRLPGVSAVAAGTGPPREDASRATAAPRRILVVDDNRDAAESLGALLAMHGHVAKVVFDGASGLAAVESFEPEIVLLDLGLPDISGYDVAARLREAGRSVALVAVTGWGQDADRKRARAAGFDAYLVKPVELALLWRTLEQLDQPAAPT